MSSTQCNATVKINGNLVVVKKSTSCSYYWHCESVSIFWSWIVFINTWQWVMWLLSTVAVWYSVIQKYLFWLSINHHAMFLLQSDSNFKSCSLIKMHDMITTDEFYSKRTAILKGNCRRINTSIELIYFYKDQNWFSNTRNKCRLCCWPAVHSCQ